ncbi:MAG: DUF4143 domain-containing protein [Dehalococcoidia bacterium]|nr:DUF4143 domain-containing protein [Dehalococcoidia bacterium]
MTKIIGTPKYWQSVYYYRDKSGLEIGAIIRLADGRWEAVEIKMGAGEVEGVSEDLLKLKKKVDANK